LRARRIDLEGLGLPWKHADYIIDADGVAVVVEETSAARIEDVEKLENTVRAIVEGGIRLGGNPEKIVAVIHGDLDPMIARILRSKSGARIGSKRVLYRAVSCDRELHLLLSEYGVYC